LATQHITGLWGWAV